MRAPASASWPRTCSGSSARKAAKLPAHFTPHSLRHTFARMMEDAGAKVSDIKARLGHDSLHLRHRVQRTV